MCGILGIFDLVDDVELLRKKALTLSKRLRHRGPDWSGIFCNDQAILVHERLAIVDVDHGAQPLISKETGAVLAANGEIYNHKLLAQSLKHPHEFQTKSDCEVILYLYEEMGTNFLNLIEGIFAFVLYDPRQGAYLIARDHIGIVPLYWGWDENGQLYVTSELKAIVDTCRRVEEFLPGHMYTSPQGTLTQYYKPVWKESEFKAFHEWQSSQLRLVLETAVKEQLMSDVPYGVLISGGIDSSIIAAIAAKYRKKRIEDDENSPAWWPNLHSFCIGLSDSPDIVAAQKVADHIGAIHHQFTFTVQEGLDVLEEVIYHLETYDITTIRAGTPMYLMARRIKAMGIKMVLSGEGADELLGGYLYFHKAPNAEEFREETLRKLFALHKYDCLRANKAMAAWGVEARVPFLSRRFIDEAMTIDPKDKMSSSDKIEKFILRKSFEGYIPNEVLWRQKEQFSDGVGYRWIDSLRNAAEEKITDKMLRDAHFRFPINTPLTKEGYWYRILFEKVFPSEEAARCVRSEPSIACSSETALRWDQSFRSNADPSGRAVRTVHNDSW